MSDRVQPVRQPMRMCRPRVRSRKRAPTKQWILSVGLLLVLAGTPAVRGVGQLSAGKQKTRVSRAIRELERDLHAILARPVFATTRWGVLVESLDRRQVLFSHQATRLFTPASNMKLYTTAAALVHLGPQFRFRTSVYAQARPDERGHIEGDLILYGRGDPNLSTRTVSEGLLTPFGRLADQLFEAGVREVFGSIVGDESYFVGPRLGAGWEWDDLQWYYGAEISALTLDDNMAEIIVQPGSQVGEPARLFLRPETACLSVINEVVTVDSQTEQHLVVDRPLGQNTVGVWGTIPLSSMGYRVPVAIHDPARCAAEYFRLELLRRGIRVHGQARKADWKEREKRPLSLGNVVELAWVESVPLSQEIRVLNKISQNLHAELLLRTLGAVVKGEGSDTKGLEVVSELLRSWGVRMQGIRLRDGSGLSRQNVISPATTVDLLRAMHSHQWRNPYMASLPVAGEDGTLQNRMKGSAAQQRVRAKTGTLAYTYSLSGYLTTLSGQELVFSIMVNDHTGVGSDVTQAIDEICARLIEFTDR